MKPSGQCTPAILGARGFPTSALSAVLRFLVALTVSPFGSTCAPTTPAANANNSTAQRVCTMCPLLLNRNVLLAPLLADGARVGEHLPDNLLHLRLAVDRVAEGGA